MGGERVWKLARRRWAFFFVSLRLFVLDLFDFLFTILSLGSYKLFRLYSPPSAPGNNDANPSRWFAEAEEGRKDDNGRRGSRFVVGEESRAGFVAVQSQLPLSSEKSSDL